MPRFSPAFAAVVAALSSVCAQQPQPRPSVVAETVALAKQKLAEGRATDAVLVLERQLAYADGDKEFRDTLRAAYAAELKQLVDPKAIEAARKNLALLGGPLTPVQPVAPQPLPAPLPTAGALPSPGGAAPGGFAEPAPLFNAAEPLAPAPVTPAPVTPVAPPSPSPVPSSDSGGIDLLKQASAVFNLARTDGSKFLEARNLFNLAFNRKLTMNSEQMTAWAYCRLKVATDALNHNPDAQTAADLAAEIEDALAAAPGHAALQTAGRELLSAAKKRAGGMPPSKRPPAPTYAEDGWEVLDTDSFRVKYRGKPGAAEAVARAAEEKRGTIFARWSAPPGHKWQPKCEIVLHADAGSFARATKLAADATGRADVTLNNGEVQSRRIDLRADDPTLTDDALPRELTHVILADLFPTQAPPKWAALGMAVLGESPDQLGRYRRTVLRCDRDGELQPVGKLLTTADVPAKGVTGFAVGSVSLVDFLVRWRGEKHFVGFLRDAQRYGAESALKRQYQVADSRDLEKLWRKSVQLGQ